MCRRAEAAACLERPPQAPEAAAAFSLGGRVTAAHCQGEIAVTPARTCSSDSIRRNAVGDQGWLLMRAQRSPRP